LETRKKVKLHLFERIAAAEPTNGYQLLRSFGKTTAAFGQR
jgi:hypothetical protein